MLRAASRTRRLRKLAVGEGQSIGAQQDPGNAIRGDRQQGVIRKSVEVLRSEALGSPNRLCHLPCCGSGMRRDIREDSTICAIAPLQEILAEQAGRADTDAEPGGYGKVVTRRLADPGVQSAEGKECG